MAKLNICICALFLGSISPVTAPTNPPGSYREMNCQETMFGIVQICSIEKIWPESQGSDTLCKLSITLSVILAVASAMKDHLKQLTNTNRHI